MWGGGDSAGEEARVCSVKEGCKDRHVIWEE
jgi:hypothetical protein